MYSLRGNNIICGVIFLSMCYFSYEVNGAFDSYTVTNSLLSFSDIDIEPLRERAKRDVAAPPPLPSTAAAPAHDAPGGAGVSPSGNANATAAPNATATASTATATATATAAANVSTAATATALTTTTIAPAVVTKTPLLGVNGSGILRVTTNTPRVSDPIFPDDDITRDMFNDTMERMKAQQNITDLKYDNHDFYNSTFIGNLTFFKEHWDNITRQSADVHPALSNSHRRATTIRLSFEFPFYGHNLRNITVATGGFVYTGDHVHNWLAATQYIAPLMANFDTKLTNDSYVKTCDDGERLTVFWENVTLQEDPNKKFTFAVTLYKNGDIIFAYKDIPVPIQDINEKEHPVKVGISDAYLSDKILFLIRRKTIYEYHRVSFKNYEIKSGTLLKLTALPTCLQYTTCESCVNHNTGFDCLWCETLKKCSSGTDRNKQDWMLRNCYKSPITNESACPATTEGSHSGDGSTAYTTDEKTPDTHTVVANVDKSSGGMSPSVTQERVSSSPGDGDGSHHQSSGVGGAVAAFVAVAIVAAVGAWTLYAFKNPHTRSGQLLIKYRPSQWSWRRGEARYTAATIHM